MGEQITDIIIIRGAPGSGKSKTAKSLAQFCPNGVRLEVDTIRQMVISVNWKNQQEHINMLQVSTRLVHDFIKLGFTPVIVVDTFSGDKIFHYMESLLQLDQNLTVKIFALFTTDEELKRRLEVRSNGEFKDFSICKKLNNDALKITYPGEYKINTTGLSPLDSAKIIQFELVKLKEMVE
jgi:hypothetical protein